MKVTKRLICIFLISIVLINNFSVCVSAKGEHSNETEEVLLESSLDRSREDGSVVKETLTITRICWETKGIFGKTWTWTKLKFTMESDDIESVFYSKEFKKANGDKLTAEKIFKKDRNLKDIYPLFEQVMLDTYALAAITSWEDDAVSFYWEDVIDQWRDSVKKDIVKQAKVNAIGVTISTKDILSNIYEVGTLVDDYEGILPDENKKDKSEEKLNAEKERESALEALEWLPIVKLIVEKWSGLVNKINSYSPFANEVYVPFTTIEDVKIVFKKHTEDFHDAMWDLFA